MKNTKRLTCAVMALTMMVSLSGCKMIEKTPKAVAKEVVAKVDGNKITRGQLDEQLSYMIEPLKQKYGENYEKNQEAKEILKEGRAKLTEILVTNMVIKSKAEDLKIKVDEKELQKRIEETKKQIRERFKTDAEYKKALEKEKLTEEKLKTRIKENQEISILSDKVYEKITKDIKVDEKELKNYYTSNLNDFTEKPNGIKVAQIVVKTEKEAKEIKKQLDKGADFAKMAKEKSIEKASKEKGGELGFLQYKQVTQIPFLLPAMSMKVGQISEPSQDERGWHIIKLMEKTDYPPKKFEEVKGRIKDKVLIDKKMNTWKDSMEKWKKEKNVKIYEKTIE